MSNKFEYLQEIYRLYVEAGQRIPASSHEIAAWAIEKRLWTPKPADVVKQCAEELSRAFREEYHTDRLGRRVRSKHAVRDQRNGEQLVLWADMESASRRHMEMAFQQRRRQVVGDCLQLKIDVDSYNDSRPDEKPIQLILDFTDDVNEVLGPISPEISSTVH